MTKLTISIRESLASAVLRHRFSVEVEKFIGDKAAFAREVYEDVYKKSDREKMAALPEGWLPTSNSMGIQFGEHGSTYEALSFSGSVHGMLSKLRAADGKSAKSVDFRVFEKHRHACVKQYTNDHKLSTKYHAIKAAGTDLLTRVNTAEKQIEAALNSVTTLPALVKAWPEIEPFTKRYFAAPSKLPTIPVSALNAMFKLPVKQAQAA